MLQKMMVGEEEFDWMNIGLFVCFMQQNLLDLINPLTYHLYLLCTVDTKK